MSNKKGEKQDQELINRFIQSKISDVSPNTLRVYRYALFEFERFMKRRRKTLSQLLKEDVSAFISKQKFKGNVSETIQPKYSAIMGLAKWLYYRDILSEKHYKEIQEHKFKKEKNKKPSTRALSSKEIEFVYQKISDPQFRMIFWVGENYGLRAKEYANLKIQDIKLTGDDPYIEIINGKGEKNRTIAVLDDHIDQWEIWLRIRSGYDLNHDYVFFTNRGRASDKAIQRYYNRISDSVHPLPQHLRKKYSELINEEKEEYKTFKKKYWFTAHDLRRTFATNYRTIKGVDIELISSALGHSKIATTQRYLREKEKDARKRYREQLRDNRSSNLF